MRVWTVMAIAMALAAAPARAADETRMYLVDPTHSNAVLDSPLAPPLKLRWQANLGVPYSPVLVQGGRVFYVRNPGTGLALSALDAGDGHELWTKSLAGIPGPYSLAVDGGRLFLGSDASADYSYGMRIESLDPATGGSQWIRVINNEYGLGSPLTAEGGQLFVIGSSGSSSLHALRQSDGADLWPAPSITSGSDSAPTLDASTVYVSVAGPQTFAFDRVTGKQRWHYGGCCTGGGGSTSHLFKGRLYAHDGLVHNADDGLVVGSWNGQPAFAADGGVELSTGLRAFGPDYATTRWTFGSASTRPLIAGAHVFGAYESSVYSLAMADGAIEWCAALTLPAGSEYPYGVAPVAAGNGLLLVSIGYGLGAFESGGSEKNTCGPTGEPGGGGGGPAPGGGGLTPPPAPATGGPALTIRAGKKHLYLGQRTNVAGRLSGVAVTTATRVVLDFDEWPFDGRWRRGATATVAPDGTFAFKLAPKRNTQIRVRLADGSLISEVVPVLADFPFRVTKIGAGGAHPQLRLTIYAFEKAKVRQRRSYAYLTRGRTQPWKLVDARKWQVITPRTVSVRLRYPRGRLRKGDHWLVCQPERTPDAFGTPTEIERRCGARTLPRGLS